MEAGDGDGAPTHMSGSSTWCVEIWSVKIWSVKIRAAKILLVAIAFAFAGMARVPAEAREITVAHLSVGGLAREFLLSLPESRAPRPTVVVLHGTWQTGLIMMHTTGLEPVAEREGLVAVYPNAMALQWNDGRAAAAMWGPRDDVAFLRMLVASLVRTGVSDPRQVYVLGFSNGGMMALRMICEATEVFSAVAVIGASLPAEVAPGCRPSAPSATLVMNGTADPFGPYQGGQVILRGGVVLSTDQTLRFLRHVNGCAPGAAIGELPDIDPSDGSRVLIKSWTNCASAAPVVLYRIEGGGHRIPNRDPGLPIFDPVLGRMNHDFDAAEAIWRFFQSTAGGRPHRSSPYAHLE